MSPKKVCRKTICFARQNHIYTWIKLPGIRCSLHRFIHARWCIRTTSRRHFQNATRITKTNWNPLEGISVCSIYFCGILTMGRRCTANASLKWREWTPDHREFQFSVYMVLARDSNWFSAKIWCDIFVIFNHAAIFYSILYISCMHTEGFQSWLSSLPRAHLNQCPAGNLQLGFQIALALLLNCI